MATKDIRTAICVLVLLTCLTTLPAEYTNSTSRTDGETINSTEEISASTVSQSGETKPDVTTVKVQESGAPDTSNTTRTLLSSNGTKNETDSPTNNTRPEGNDQAVTLSTSIGENSTEFVTDMSTVHVTTEAEKKKYVNTAPGATDSGSDPWEQEAAAKAKREMIWGMVAGVIFGVVTLIVCCVMWKLCCGKLCDQHRHKIMPMDFRGADQLPPPPPPPGAILRSPSRPPSRSDQGHRPPSRSDQGHRPPSRSDQGHRPPSRSDQGHRPPSRSDQ
ncbi:hypothetical protein LSAT2_027833, partial [Lamellibrachia satsuma]